MKQDLCLGVVLCLLLSTLGRASLPPDGDDQRQMSAVPGPEPEQRTTGSNSPDTDEGEERVGVSLSEKELQDGEHVFALQDNKTKIAQVAASENVRSRMVVSPWKPDDDDNTGRLLVAVARTLVTSTASTTTVTVLSTCHDNAAVAVTTLPACAGKKRRRFILMNPETLIADSSLDSSLQSEPELFDNPIERTGRFIIWSSSVTTVLSTATSTNTVAANIVTAAYKCSFAGLVTCAG